MTGTIRALVVLIPFTIFLIMGGHLYMNNQAREYGVESFVNPLENSTGYNATALLINKMGETVRDADPDEPGGAEFAYVLATGALNALRLFFDFGKIVLDGMVEPIFVAQGIPVPTWAAWAIRLSINGFIIVTLMYAIFFRAD